MEIEADNEKSRVESRPFSIWLYLLIVFGLSWPFQIISVVWAGSALTAFLLNGTSMVMVTVGTYLTGRWVFRDGFAGAGWSWGRWKSHLAVLGLAAALWILPTVLDLAAGTVEVPADLSKARFAWVLLLPVLTLVPAFGEEFGWRGYMLPRLAQRFTARKAVIVHSIIWWAWHMPFLAGTGYQIGAVSADEVGLSARASGMAAAGVVVFASGIPGMLHGVLFAFIWTRSGSLAVATVYHAAYDGFRDSLGIIVGTGPITQVFVNIGLIALGILFLWKGKWVPHQSWQPAPVEGQFA